MLKSWSACEKIDTLVVDKTGTLTAGQAEGIVAVVPSPNFDGRPR